MSLSTLLDRALSDPLHAARSGRAIGYLGWNVPIELILAAGAVPVQLSALPDSPDTALADRFLENSFSAQSRLVHPALWGSHKGSVCSRRSPPDADHAGNTPPPPMRPNPDPSDPGWQ